MIGRSGFADVALAAGTLRAACRCAGCRRGAIEGAGPAVGVVTIARVEPMGGRAVTIAFSDGHDRGVYPWDYLDALCTAHHPSTNEAAA